MNRRAWLAAAASFSVFSCSRTKATGYYGYGLVANAGDSSLAAVDLTTFRLKAAIGLNSPPSMVVGSPTVTPTHQAYVLTPGNGTIHLIDDQFRRAKVRRIADQVNEIGLTGDGKRLMALSNDPHELIEVDLATLEPLARHKLSFRADSLDYSALGYAAAGNAAGSVELIHLASGKRMRRDTPALGAVRFRGDGQILLVADLRNRSLLALNVPALQVVAELPLAMRPDNLCFNSDQGQLFVSGAGMDGVAVVFPYRTLEVDQTLLAGRDPGLMTCSATPAYLFVGSSTGSDVCILNIDTRKIVGIVEMGGQPSFMTVTPDSQYALILDEASGDMGVIDVRWIRANRLKTGAALYTMISVGSRPVDLAVIPRMS